MRTHLRRGRRRGKKKVCGGVIEINVKLGLVCLISLRGGGASCWLGRGDGASGQGTVYWCFGEVKVRGGNEKIHEAEGIASFKQYFLEKRLKEPRDLGEGG